jgi:hypothetical protein
MSAPFTASMLDGGNLSSQPDYRRNYNGRDDWGRLWLLCVDIKSGGLAAPPIPAGWDDPLAVPAKYITVDQQNPNRVIIAYEQWAREMEEATKVWEEKLHNEGEELYGQKYDPNEAPDTRLLKRVGTRPLAPEVIRAAGKGDPRFLGVEPQKVIPVSDDRLMAQFEAMRQENERLKALLAEEMLEVEETP